METRKIVRYSLITIVLLLFSKCVVGVFSDDENKVTSPQTKAELLETQRIEDSMKIEFAKADSIQFSKKLAAVAKLKTFKVKKDEFSASEFYTDKRAPKYNNINFIYPYIGYNGSNYYLRLKFQYAAKKWLFINTVKIKTETNQYTLTGKFERDNKSTIWEWSDMPVNQSTLIMLEDMATSKSILIRYEGRQYQKDRKLTSKEISIIKETLSIYTPLK